MPIDGISPTAVVLPALNFAYRAFQTGFELAAVPKQTHDLLDTISQVTADVKRAKALRRKKSQFLDPTEKEAIDLTIQNVEKALDGVEALVEHPRVDMMTNGDKIGFKSRAMWVMRDATSVPVAMTRLGVMVAALNREIIIMRGLQDRSFDDDMPIEDDKAPPPPYQATRKTLHLRRQSTKRQSTWPITPVDPSSPMTEIDPRDGWTGEIGATWPSASDLGNVLPPVSQLERNFVSPVSELDSNVLSPPSELGRNFFSSAPELDGSPIPASSKLATAAKPTPPPRQVSEQLPEQRFGSLEELVAVRTGSRSEPCLMPSRLFASAPRTFKWNQPSDFDRVASPLASDCGGSKASSARSLRRSRSQSWLAFQASRPISPAINLALR